MPFLSTHGHGSSMPRGNGVLTVTPENNIRVDLLLIWPLLTVLRTWAVWRSVGDARTCMQMGRGNPSS
jgi:hypothetical protein